MSNVDTKNAKILLVDDFEIVRVMLKNALGELGYRNVDEAENGRVALVKIKEAQSANAPFALVFCDWNMPDVSGIEVLETCRANPTLKELPIVMVTAESDQGFVIRALKAGANDYIVKPISAEILEKKVTKIMAKIAAKAA